MKIEKHGRSQFVENCERSMRLSNKKTTHPHFLAPSGILEVNISNQHQDTLPIDVTTQKEEVGLSGV